MVTTIAHAGMQPGPDQAFSLALCAVMPESFRSSVSALGIFVGLVELSEWSPWLAEADGMLDVAERERVGRQRFSSDRDALTLTYALHRLMLAQFLGCDPGSVLIERDGLGCPRLSGGEVSTSLSHAGRRAAAFAITATGAIGVDVEPTSRAAVMPELADWICHPSERMGRDAVDGVDGGEALLGLWVRKEAYLKAAGIGMRREMRSFPAPDRGLLPLPKGGLCQVNALNAGRSWHAAVAGAPGMPITCSWLRPLVSYEWRASGPPHRPARHG
ncbi:4'-phosphopantetheinyl transferase family protein [Lysobacter olei]